MYICGLLQVPQLHSKRLTRPGHALDIVSLRKQERVLVVLVLLCVPIVHVKEMSTYAPGHHGHYSLNYTRNNLKFHFC